MSIKHLTGGIIIGACFVMSMLYAIGVEFRVPGEPISQNKPKESPNSNLPSTCYVERVYDGDTIGCRFPGQKRYERVRLLGVDSPESKHSYKNKTGVNQDYAIQSTDYLSNLAQKKTVYLTYDERPFDRYGRYLAYVFLDKKQSKTSLVNSMILENGMAKTLIIAPNLKMQAELLQAENKAKRLHKGIWRH